MLHGLLELKQAAAAGSRQAWQGIGQQVPEQQAHPEQQDALDLVPLYVREQEEKEISDCAVKALLAVKSCVEQLARKYAIDSQALPI